MRSPLFSPEFVWNQPPFAIFVNLADTLGSVASAKFDDLQSAAIRIMNLRIWDLLSSSQWSEHILRNPACCLAWILSKQSQENRRDVKVMRDLQRV
jgi:hypothetical protein